MTSDRLCAQRGTTVRVLASLLAFGLLVSGAGAGGAAAPGASGNDVLKATLANGLRVVIVPNALAPVVSTNLAYLVGSRDDPAEFPGMAHAQEHMMFRGTKDLSTSELGTIATALGGAFNAETSDTLTQFEFTVPVADLDAVLRIESDRMRDILDAQSQWENERGAIEQEVARDDSSPGADFFRDAQNIAFAGTPYGHDGVGTKAAFDRLTGDELKRFYRRWYAPNNAVLVIAGNVDPQKTLADVRAHFDGVPRRPVAEHARATFAGPLKRTVIKRNTTLIYALAAVGLRLPGVESPDFLACFLLQQVLGSARGPLRALVDSGQALDGEWVSMPYVPEAQLGYAVAALPPNRDASAMTYRLETILRGYAQDGVPRELFETTRRQAIAEQELSRNSISALADDWVTTIALDQEPSIAREQELLAGVTLADVDRAAKKYLNPDHAIVAALTPSANASQSAAPAPPRTGPEQPLEAQPPVTHLPEWAQPLLSTVSVPDAKQPYRTTLQNGMTLIVQPETISDSVVGFGAVRTNPALQEPQGKEGVSAVLGAMFAYGTADRDRTAFLRAQDDIDTSVGAGPRFGFQTTSKNADRALALLAENELKPRFDDTTFEIARKRVLENLETTLSGTGAAATRATARKLVPPGDPTLREPTADSLARLTLDDVKAYYAATMRPDLATLVIVGNVSAEAARAAVDREFGSWHATGPPPSLELPPVPLNAAADVHIPVPSSDQASVTLTQNVAVDRGSPQYYPLQLGTAILGGGSLSAEQSRLFRDIRQNAGLVYSIASQYSAERTRAQFSVQYACAPANASRIEGLVVDEIVKMQKEPVGDFELSLAKAAIARRTVLGAASSDDIGGALLDDAVNGFPLDQDRVDAKAILGTDARAVEDAFAANLHPNDFVRLVLGP